MPTMTIRNVSPELARALQQERARSGRSLNQTVLDLLGRQLGIDGGPAPSNGLGRLAGGWSADELARFDEATADLERTDEDVWG